MASEHKKRPPLGAVYIRGEGKPMHPDDFDNDFTDEEYERQLKAYNECYGIETD